MGFFGSSNDEEKSVEELNQDLQEKEKEIKKKEGKRRLEKLRKQKKQELKNKEKQLRKEEFKQSKAGKVINTLGNELGKLAEATDSERAANLANAAEKVDGDGKGDTSSALGIGLTEKGGDKRDIEVGGDLEVEGDVVTKGQSTGSGSSEDTIPLFEDDDSSNGGIL